MSTYYALNTEDRINPTDIAGTGKFMNEQDGALILRKVARNGVDLAKSIWVLTGWHHEGVKVGRTIRVVGDQSGRDLGWYKVVGVVDWNGTGQADPVGEVPNRALKHYVMK